MKPPVPGADCGPSPTKIADRRSMKCESSESKLATESEALRSNALTHLVGSHCEHQGTASGITYRRLIESAKGGLLILDAGSGTITDVNPFLVEMLSSSHQEILGKRSGIWNFSKISFPTKQALRNFSKANTSTSRANGSKPTMGDDYD